MKTKLAALLASLAVLGGTAAARADAVPPMGTQAVALTDTEMDGVTAGHLFWTTTMPPRPGSTTSNGWHFGQYMTAAGSIRTGWHIDRARRLAPQTSSITSRAATVAQVAAAAGPAPSM